MPVPALSEVPHGNWYCQTCVNEALNSTSHPTSEIRVTLCKVCKKKIHFYSMKVDYAKLVCTECGASGIINLSTDSVPLLDNLSTTDKPSKPDTNGQVQATNNTNNNNNDINYNNTTNSDGRKVANEDSAIEKSVNVSQKRKRDQEKVETNNNNNKAKTIVASDSENRKDENRVVCLTCKLPGDSTTLCFCESCDSAYHLSCLGQLEKVETFC